MDGILSKNKLAVFFSVAGLVTLAYLTAGEALTSVMSLLVWIGFVTVLVGLIAALYLGWHTVTARAAQLASDRELARLKTTGEAMRLQAYTSLLRAALHQIDAGAIYPVDIPAGKFSHLPRPQVLPQPDQLLLEVGEAGNTMEFEAIARRGLADRGAGRFIAFGGAGSGKTTLAKYIVDYATDEIVHNRGGQIFIIDPHAPEVVWGDEVKVVGAGMDYEAIAKFLQWVIADVKQRYKDGCGDDSRPLPHPHRPNFIICEEWAGVIAELQTLNAWGNIHNRTFYMDARKAGWGFFLVAHAHTVGALGLKGMGNLLSGVEFFISLEKDAISGRYSATIGQSFKDKNPYTLITPGPYDGPLYYTKKQAAEERGRTDKYLLGPPDEGFTIDLSSLKSQPTEHEESVLEAAKSATSWNNLHHLVSGTTTNVSSPQAQKYREILQKYGQTVSF